ncbi:MAG: S-adenosylmethionine:tRNA ribosyltransferase-isomerase, partial [Myxococcota bacterium]
GLRLRAFIRANRTPRPGQPLTVEGSDTATLHLESREDDGAWVLRLMGSEPLGSLLEGAGHVPLPPYIVQRRRALGEPEEVSTDRDRYQTVYARHRGAVAAPTAGLHFTEAMIDALHACGVGVGFVTLHVGAGTFKPLASQVPLDQQTLHREHYIIGAELEAQIAQCTASGGRIVAVGTTSARALEDQGVRWRGREVKAGVYTTQLFIQPGWSWQLVDALVTNFHLPRSSLLVMIAALIGYPATMHLYEKAIAERFRFYSYGDASLLMRRAPRTQGVLP